MRSFGQQAVAYATTIPRLPRRMDQLADRIDRGQISVRTPDVDRRLRSIERSISRAVSAVMFATLLFAGVLLLQTTPPLAWVLMGYPWCRC